MTDPQPTPEPKNRITMNLQSLPIVEDETAAITPVDFPTAYARGYFAAPDPVHSSRPNAANQAWDQLRRDHASGRIASDVFYARLRDVIEYDLVAGGREPAGARTRAAYLVGYGFDIDFWRAQAVRVLTLYLHAAALGDKTIADVQAWVDAALDNARVQDEIRAHLGTSPDAPTMRADFEQWLTTGERTAGRITAAMRAAFERLHEHTNDQKAEPQ